MGCLGIKSVHIWIFILLLWWWSGLRLGVLRIRRHFGSGYFQEVMEFCKRRKHTVDFLVVGSIEGDFERAARHALT